MGDVPTGFLDIAVTATDAGGLSVSDTFRVTVANVNRPPSGEPAAMLATLAETNTALA